MPVTAIIDSRTSHTVMSQNVARRLNMHQALETTSSAFLTAGGEKEKPWEILKRCTSVSRQAPMDAPVTGAKSYDLLFGNDWLVQPACHMYWDKRKMRFMVTPDNHDEVDYDEEGKLGAPATFHVVKQEKPQQSISRPTRNTAVEVCMMKSSFPTKSTVKQPVEALSPFALTNTGPTLKIRPLRQTTSET